MIASAWLTAAAIVCAFDWSHTLETAHTLSTPQSLLRAQLLHAFAAVWSQPTYVSVKLLSPDDACPAKRRHRGGPWWRAPQRFMQGP